jgi:hypothetical protein
VVAKARARANLILKCFISKHTDTLIKAFIAYVRPILEYASPVWSPYHVGDSNKIESVLRAFTKRLPGMTNIPYEDRLVMLGLERLETRRLRLDMQFVYKILFGIVDVDYSTMFSLNTAQRTRGHDYKLNVQRSRLETRRHFFSNRIVKLWNSLPAQPQHFKSYKTFCSFLNTVNIAKLHNKSD